MAAAATEMLHCSNRDGGGSGSGSGKGGGGGGGGGGSSSSSSPDRPLARVAHARGAGQLSQSPHLLQRPENASGVGALHAALDIVR